MLNEERISQVLQFKMPYGVINARKGERRRVLSMDDHKGSPRHEQPLHVSSSATLVVFHLY